jgi:4-oxalocrotonate tautomerase
LDAATLWPALRRSVAADYPRSLAVAAAKKASRPCAIMRRRARASADRRLCNAPPCASMPPRPIEEDVMPEVVFYALGGRSVEQKRALIKDFTDAVVKNYKVDASAVTITIVESSKEDKAKGGVLFSDMAPAKS